MEPLIARGVSLWLLPEAAEGDRLARVISRLASRLGTPAFAPHVTLLPGLAFPKDEVVDRTAPLLTDLEALSVALGSPAGRDEPFQRLFLPVAMTFRLVHAHALFRSAFAPGDERPFEPHLSLVYGPLAEAEKASLLREIVPDLPKRLRLSTLEVVETEGPVEKWQSLARFPLPVPASGHDRKGM
ncbi:MAG TPA: 2'-5' RNA ligase family protein [Vicinamibacteria bacterium]